MTDFLLPIWNPFIVHPLLWVLRSIDAPLTAAFPQAPGVAGALTIILFTLALRVLMLPLSLMQIRSQRAQLSMQPQLKELQRKFKGDREGMARAQMSLYKENGFNPTAGCLPLVVQLPILFGMYSALSQLSTMGLTLDQVQLNQISAGTLSYEASRTVSPFPTNLFPLTVITVVPTSDAPVDLTFGQDESFVKQQGNDVLSNVQPLTLHPGQATPNNNPSNPSGGKALLYFRPAGSLGSDGTYNRATPVQANQPYLVEVMVDAPQPVLVDGARAAVHWDASLANVTESKTPPLEDVSFKSSFAWLPSLGLPDVIRVFGIGIPGALLILMTISSFLSQRVATMPTTDPQQQAMMKSMAFMPLMYLFFFLNTPAGLVLYWLTSNLFTMLQQYFTLGLGLLARDVFRLTGKDVQPPWAHQYAAALESGDTDSPRSNGAANGATNRPRPTNNGTTSVGALGHTLDRTRPTPGKGRKRGKR